MDFGVHEDVVDIQIHVVNSLGGIELGTGEHGCLSDPLLDVGNGKCGGGTLGSAGGSLLFNGELEIQITGGGEKDVGLVGKVDGDETLSIRNGHGGNSKALILVNDIPASFAHFLANSLASVVSPGRYGHVLQTLSQVGLDYILSGLIEIN